MRWAWRLSLLALWVAFVLIRCTMRINRVFRKVGL